MLVVSIEQAVAAPTCTLRLADAGARVIKIERAEGETARHYDKAVHGTSAYFAWLNRGKESIVLDLKTEPDLALLKQMIAQADIFVQNLAPGAAARLGLASDKLVAQFPQLIAVNIVGYGQDTPYRNEKAYDLLVQAESGICSVTGTAQSPARVGVSICDIGTGMNAHAAVLEALIARQKTAAGKVIDVAMFDTMADWMSVPLLHFEHQQKITERIGVAHAAIAPYGAFDCRDGQVVISIQNPSEWPNFCQLVLQRPDLTTDPRFIDNPARLENRQLLDQLINQIFVTLPREEIFARSHLAGTVCSQLSTVADLSTHPALKRMVTKLPDGEFSAVAPPLHPNLTPGPVPEIGEHSEKIRREFGENP
jgi:crotonobetainyl-CoA:carnitine CoA-transferase CaiB-like acyl-CoA transferase